MFSGKLMLSNLLRVSTHTGFHNIPVCSCVLLFILVGMLPKNVCLAAATLKQQQEDSGSDLVVVFVYS